MIHGSSLTRTRGHRPARTPGLQAGPACHALFNALSPDVAQALRQHLASAARGQPSARVADELGALGECCRLAVRSEVLAVARQRFRLTRPHWCTLLGHWSTSDLLVRLYLESRTSFASAQRSLLLGQGELELRRASYVADVVPSFDRTNKLKEVFVSLLCETGRRRPAGVRAHVGEHELCMFAGHSRSCERSEPMRPRGRRAVSYRLSLVFYYESAVILLKAPTAHERQLMSSRFAEIFTRDARYFEPELARLPATSARELALLYKTKPPLYKTAQAYEQTNR